MLISLKGQSSVSQNSDLEAADFRTIRPSLAEDFSEIPGSDLDSEIGMPQNVCGFRHLLHKTLN